MKTFAKAEHITTPDQLQAHLEASQGKLTLYHGGKSVFHEFEARSRNRHPSGELYETNSDFGIHLTADLFCAYGYAPEDGAVLVAQAEISKLYPVTSRDVYLSLEPEQYAEWREQLIEAGYDGIVADDLGEDLSEACVIFDATKIKIIGHLPASLGEDFFMEKGAEIYEADDVWPGVSFDHNDAPDEPEPAIEPVPC